MKRVRSAGKFRGRSVVRFMERSYYENFISVIALFVYACLFTIVMRM